jgi:hypothetical protein
MVRGLEQPDTWKAPLSGSVKGGLHQPATNPSILPLRVYRDRSKASYRGALVEKVAAHNLATHFCDNTEKPRMREQHSDQIGGDIN